MITEDRLLRALRAIVREFLPRVDFYGLYDYRVVLQNGALFDLQAVRAGVGLPDLRDVEPWPGAAGQGATLTLGSSVLVAFIEGDPARPFVAYYSPASGFGYLPSGITIDATGVLRIGASATFVEAGAAAAPVIRIGDTVQITPGNGSGVVTGIVTVTSGTAQVPPAVSRVLA